MFPVTKGPITECPLYFNFVFLMLQEDNSQNVGMQDEELNQIHVIQDLDEQ